MIVAVVLLCMGLAISLLNRGFFNPASITLILLALSEGLASLQLFGLYSFDSIATRIIAIGGVSVFAGAVSALSIRQRRGRRVEAFTDEQDLIRYRRLNLSLAVAAVVIPVARWPQLQILLSGGSLADVRNAYLGYGTDSAAVDLVDRLFVGPVLTVALPVFLWSLLRSRTNTQFVISFMAVVALNQLTSGGRFIFLYAGVMVLAMLARSGKLHLRTARARIVLVALGVAVIVFTLARGSSLLFVSYTYFAVPVPLLAHWAVNVDSAGIQTYGASFFYGVLTLIFRLCEVIGSNLGSGISDAVALPQEYWVEVLPGRQFNAFVTMFYHFFLDFRWIGVVLGGFAWGVVGQWSFRRMWNSGPRATFFGLMMLQVAVMTFVRWEFANGSLVIGLLMLPFFVMSKREPLGVSADHSATGTLEKWKAVSVSKSSGGPPPGCTPTESCAGTTRATNALSKSQSPQARPTWLGGRIIDGKSTGEPLTATRDGDSRRDR